MRGIATYTIKKLQDIFSGELRQLQYMLVASKLIRSRRAMEEEFTVKKLRIFKGATGSRSYGTRNDYAVWLWVSNRAKLPPDCQPVHTFGGEPDEILMARRTTKTDSFSIR